MAAAFPVLPVRANCKDCLISGERNDLDGEISEKLVELLLGFWPRARHHHDSRFDIGWRTDQPTLGRGYRRDEPGSLGLTEQQRDERGTVDHHQSKWPR